MMRSKFKTHPEVFPYLFFVEMWERFGYYGMQFILIFFMMDRLHMHETKDALPILGAFLAVLYALPNIGGWVADHLFGIKRTLIAGAFLLALGYLSLSLVASNMEFKYFYLNSTNLFYLSLAIIAVGNGCFKPNPTSLLAKAYKKDDPRIDSGYTLFYLSINIGSAVSIALTPIIAHAYGYASAFGICSLGLIVGLINFLRRYELFDGLGSNPDFQIISFNVKLYFFTGVITTILLVAELIKYPWLVEYVLITFVLIIYTTIFILSLSLPKVARNKLWACLLLIIITIAFWTIYNQMFGLVNIFILKNVDRHLFGLEVPAASYGVLNSIFIIGLAPIFAWFYRKLQQRKVNFTIAWKFAVGNLLAALGMLSFWLAGQNAVDGMISSWWIVLFYAMLSAAELLVSAIGLAMVAKFSPSKYISMVYGAFLFAVSLGGWLSTRVGSLLNLDGTQITPQESLQAYVNLFTQVGFWELIVALVAILLAPIINRLSNEYKQDSAHNIVEDSV